MSKLFLIISCSVDDIIQKSVSQHPVFQKSLRAITPLFLLLQNAECTGNDGSAACWNQGSCDKAYSDFCTSTLGGQVRFILPPIPPLQGEFPADPHCGMLPVPQPKQGLCTPAALCRPASPVWTKGHFSQCNSDQGCAAYGTNDWSRPPYHYCCDELAQIAAFYCDGVDSAKLAKWAAGYFGKPCSASPDCVTQGFNSSVPFFADSSKTTTPTPTKSSTGGSSPAAAVNFFLITAAAAGAAAFVVVSV